MSVKAIFGALGALCLLVTIGCMEKSTEPQAESDDSLTRDYRPEKKVDPITGHTLVKDQASGEWYVLASKRRLLESPEAAKVLAKMGPNLKGSAVDWSGQVQVNVWECWSDYGGGAHRGVGCEVGPGEVLIGGGVKASYVFYGRFITESRPLDWGLVTWVASTKDHIDGETDYTLVYAIGLKIAGVSRSTLHGQTSLVTQTSFSKENHPQTSAYSSSVGHKLLGGGARVNYTGGGNLLVYTEPGTDVAQGWYVKSKDHIRADPATITAYAIGINPVIPGWGTIEISQKSSPPIYASTGQATTVVDVDAGWVLACPGGGTNWTSGSGRMLTNVMPDLGAPGKRSRVGAKDHLKVSAGWLTATILQIRKKP